MAHRIRLRGLVQGVGFRPAVWRLASECGVDGWVRNDGAGLEIAVDGPRSEEFLARLPDHVPRPARVDATDVLAPLPIEAGKGFVIRDSLASPLETRIGPDVAVCPDCLADVCDPSNRRWRYALTTCAECGPRYTISTGLPFDRARTSLADFALCPACAAEYASPADRRFHAETVACPVCGPQLRLHDAAGCAVDGDPLAETVARLQAGQIVAIQGVGGFHLVCDADQPEVVARLRVRKARPAKPLAVMVLNAASLADWAELSPAEQAVFASPLAPIVLLRQRSAESGARRLPEAIAPGLAWVGVMRPNAPVHALLWHEALGRPAGTAWLQAPHPWRLVMTSANRAGEPLEIDPATVRQRLAGIADAYLSHTRPIVARCDDSVVRVDAGGLTWIRRARGAVPQPIALPDDGPTVLGVGAYLKNTVALLHGRQAWLSPHLGTLDNWPTRHAAEQAVEQLLAAHAAQPTVIAHDAHPDFPSTRLAGQLAERLGAAPCLVPHHAAHLAAVAAEQGWTPPVLGLTLDGLGLGDDGTLWGGELLAWQPDRVVRWGHLAPLALPGGDRAAREPWRMALAALVAAGCAVRIPAWQARQGDGLDEAVVAGVLAQLQRPGLCPQTTSLGRWFDAVAGLLGVTRVNRYDGEAAMRLESLATETGEVAPLSGGFVLNEALDGQVQLDLRPLIPHLLESAPAAGAAVFHATLVEGLAQWLLRAVDALRIDQCVLGGGCAMNVWLLDRLRVRLAAVGVDLRVPRQVPANDGGVALGQAWLARWQALHAAPEL